MKKVYALMFALFMVNGANCQYNQPCVPCLPEGITFTTQSQIDNFHESYPGCTEIQGDVSILSGVGIVNLLGLYGLNSIGGNLSIKENYHLTNLSGLNSLTTIHGSLQIEGNTNMTSLTGLNGLNLINGNLTIKGNHHLTTFSGLNSLTTIAGSCAIKYNSVLNLSGLNSLTTLNGDFEISGNDLTSLMGLNGLNSIGGNLTIGFNDYLADLSGLGSLDTIYGDFTLKFNYLLMNPIGLTSLTTINGDFNIIANANLTCLSGLENLTSINGNFNVSLARLENFTGMSSLVNVGGIGIVGNNHLLTLAGLENVNSGTVSGLMIAGNPSLSNCQIQSICAYLSNPNGGVNIYDNAPGCNSSIELAAGCGITMSCLPVGNYHFLSQSDIDNFHTYYPECTELKGDVFIRGGDIRNLNGLNGVTSFGEYFNYTKVSSTMLTSLAGLETLTSIGAYGYLDISSNDSLTTLLGIENIDADSFYHLLIYGNKSLSSCNVLSVCDYLVDPFGDIDIGDNAPGCNSDEEVLDSCGITAVNNLDNYSQFWIYPNPTSTAITVETTTRGSLTIHGTSGQAILQQTITEPATTIDVRGWKGGVYFVRVTGEKGVQVGKFVKQ